MQPLDIQVSIPMQHAAPTKAEQQQRPVLQRATEKASAVQTHPYALVGCGGSIQKRHRSVVLAATAAPDPSSSSSPLPPSSSSSSSPPSLSNSVEQRLTVVSQVE